MTESNIQWSKKQTTDYLYDKDTINFLASNMPDPNRTLFVKEYEKAIIVGNYGGGGG
ncbi:MAG: hypothetical protein LBT02_01010 [Rickettsiales bacterium]|jgi:hypothetical protein|nr:hypothetical protein [Rickettsiales bacterium]